MLHRTAQQSTHWTTAQAASAPKSHHDDGSDNDQTSNISTT